MKALSTTWQSHLQSSVCTNLSESGHLYSFPAAFTLLFEKCWFLFPLSAFLLHRLSGDTIKTMFKEIGAIQCLTMLALGP